MPVRVYFICFTICTIVLRGCTIGVSPTQKQPNLQQLPLYPGAAHVTIEERDVDLRVTSFQTHAPVDQVLAWYRDVLIADGWQLRKTFPDGLAVGYLSRQPYVRAYGLQVVIALGDEGQTQVELRLRTTGPM